MYSIVLMAALAGTGDTPGWGHRGCWGCHGCWGWSCRGCYGCWGWSCHGCWGVSYWGHGCYGCYGCYGCHGCYGCYGGCWGVVPYQVMPPAAPAAKPAEQAPPPKDAPGEAEANRARVVVELPEDAKLYFDDQLMKTTSSRRVFNTPILERGQAYYYVLRAEVVIDGKTHTETKQVIVRPGQTSTARFGDLIALVNGAQERAVAAAAAGEQE